MPDSAVLTSQRRRRLLLTLPWIPVAVLLPVWLFAVTHPSQPAASRPPRISVGQPAPDFSARTLGGGSVTLKQFRGKPVLINFWATWCVPCRNEMPAIQRVWLRHQSRGFSVLAIDFRESDRVLMRNFLREIGVSFDPVLDPDGVIATKYEVSIGLPTSIFVDRQGRIHQLHLGEMQEPYIDAQVRAML